MGNHVSSDENGGMHHHERLRGTEEQQRLLRLHEISTEIAALEAERVELLVGGSDIALSELGLSVRCVNALSNDDIHTIADVIQCENETALLRVPNFGRKHLRELREALQSRDSWFY